MFHNYFFRNFVIVRNIEYKYLKKSINIREKFLYLTLSLEFSNMKVIAIVLALTSVALAAPRVSAEY